MRATLSASAPCPWRSRLATWRTPAGSGGGVNSRARGGISRDGGWCRWAAAAVGNRAAQATAAHHTLRRRLGLITGLVSSSPETAFGAHGRAAPARFQGMRAARAQGRSGGQRGDLLAAQLGLGDEAPRARALDQRPVVRAVAAGREHDNRRVAV